MESIWSSQQGLRVRVYVTGFRIARSILLGLAGPLFNSLLLATHRCSADVPRSNARPWLAGRPVQLVIVTEMNCYHCPITMAPRWRPAQFICHLKNQQRLLFDS